MCVKRTRKNRKKIRKSALLLCGNWMEKSETKDSSSHILRSFAQKRIRTTYAIIKTFSGLLKPKRSIYKTYKQSCFGCGNWKINPAVTLILTSYHKSISNFIFDWNGAYFSHKIEYTEAFISLNPLTIEGYVLSPKSHENNSCQAVEYVFVTRFLQVFDYARNPCLTHQGGARLFA